MMTSKKSGYTYPRAVLLSGFQWNFKWKGASIINTCPLDSFLMLLIATLEGKCLLRDYVELRDMDSVLSQVFAHIKRNKWDEARVIWMTKWLGLDCSQDQDLWGNVVDLFLVTARSNKRCPLDQSCWLKWDFEVTCGRRDGCTGNQLPSQIDDDREETTEDMEVVTIKHRTRFTIMVSSQQTFFDAMEELLGEHIASATSCIRRSCQGPRVHKKAYNISWPHCIFFECPGHSLSDIPFTFVWQQKRFIFRGTVLFGNGHFCAVIRMYNGWMHYDDMSHPKFTYFDIGNEEAAQMGKTPNLAMFEVVDIHEEKNFRNESCGWKDIFIGKSHESTRPKRSPTCTVEDNFGVQDTTENPFDDFNNDMKKQKREP